MMKTMMVICAMYLAGSMTTRFVASIGRKKPLWIMSVVSALEILALGFLFRFCVVIPM